MLRTTSVGIGLLTVFAPFLGGCGGPQQNMQEMKPPPRPAELDKLDRLLGRWEGTAEMKMPGVEEPMKSTGINRVEWACDKRVLMENLDLDLDDGSKMTGIGLWTWDPKRGRYRTWFFDSFGSVFQGWAKFANDSDTLNFKGQGTNPMTGKPTYGEGTLQFTTDNTMTWTWKEWDDPLKWGPATEMTGTSQKK